MLAHPKVKCQQHLLKEKIIVCVMLSSYISLVHDFTFWLWWRPIDDRSAFVYFAGWAPTRRLKDVIWGLNSLFSVSQEFSYCPFSLAVVFFLQTIIPCLLSLYLFTSRHFSKIDNKRIIRNIWCWDLTLIASCHFYCVKILAYTSGRLREGFQFVTWSHSWTHTCLKFSHLTVCYCDAQWRFYGANWTLAPAPITRFSPQEISELIGLN
jgi:hypothetical protein